MPGQIAPVKPVRKSVTVPAPPQRAFELFTAHMHEWWPLATHSVSTQDAVSVTFGRGPGAAITETAADGTTCAWGTITRWEPPGRVAFTWHPGTPSTQATSVDVTFTPDGSGSTLVQLTHSGWEHRPDGPSARHSYDSGWNPVISSYAQAALQPTR